MDNKEFAQIAELMIARLNGYRIDGRKLSKKVRKWALDRGLITIQENKYEIAWDSNKFIAELETPCESIIMLMDKEGIFKDGSIGKSITKYHFWNYLDINDSKYSLFSEKDRLAQEALLIRLHQAGFIYFQSAGSLWDIRKTD